MNLKNSMILANMMSQKPKIMYATIKGTLTGNDGVFSGFSTSNYLEGQTNITSEMQQQYLQSFEFQIKIKISTITQETQILYFPYRGILSGIALRSSGAIRWYVISSNYSIISTSLFANGDTVYIKGKISNGIATLYSSIDGTNWITEGSVTLGTLEATNVNIPIRLGKSGTTSAPGFEGSIDLPNSYIKLGSTKYNLQAVVGYTIVGSPTITDGVASGFSASDYLQLPNFPILDNNSKVEIYVESKIYDNSATYAILSAYNGDTYDIKIMIDTAKRLYGYIYNNSNSTRYYTRLWCSDLTPTSLLRIKYTIQNNLLELARKIDLLDWGKTEVSLTENFSYTKATPLCIGRSLNGEIHIKNTYIKINNKLWFNGQQA